MRGKVLVLMAVPQVSYSRDRGGEKMTKLSSGSLDPIILYHLTLRIRQANETREQATVCFLRKTKVKKSF